MIIHYRLLANRRDYESIRLPFVQVSSTGRDLTPGERDVMARALRKSVKIVHRATAGIRGLPGPRARARTTQEIPVAVDATLPAIAAALARLEADLVTLGLGHHAARARAIGLAVETVRETVRDLPNCESDADPIIDRVCGPW